MSKDEATPEGQRLIAAWIAAQERLRRAQSEVNGAECDVNNTRRALAKWLLPEDAKPGEKIAVWQGDSLIQVEVPAESHKDVIVTIRKRGRYGLRAA